MEGQERLPGWDKSPQMGNPSEIRRVRRASRRRGTGAESFRISRSLPSRGGGKGLRGISRIKSSVGVLRNLQEVQQGQSQRPCERFYVLRSGI